MSEGRPDTRQPPDWYLTLGAPGSAEIRISRSRFIARAMPVPDEAVARTTIRELAAEFHDARHVCHAWRLGIPPAIVEQRSDAGEPAGTAGEPLLHALRTREVTGALVVVIRYFGGVKLGTGGLSRAYAEAAEGAVAAAGVRRVPLGLEFQVQFPYSWQKTLSRLLDQCRGRVVTEQYGPDVRWRIWLPHSTWRDFAQGAAAATAGAVSLGEPL